MATAKKSPTALKKPVASKPASKPAAKATGTMKPIKEAFNRTTLYLFHPDSAGRTSIPQGSVANYEREGSDIQQQVNLSTNASD